MPKYDIDSINYIVTGKTEKIINLDVSRVKGFDDKSEAGPYYPDEIVNMTYLTDENADKIADKFQPAYNSHRMKILSSDPVDENRGITNNIYALFDFKKVAVQSTIAKTILKGVKSQSLVDPDNYIDIYGPHLDKNPIGFCQFGDANAIGMSDATKRAPVFKGSSQEKDRNQRFSEGSGMLDWQDMLFDKEKMFNYTYIPLSNLVITETHIDGTVTTRVPESYYDYLTSHGALSASYLSNLLLEKYNHQEIAHNYIYEVPTSNSTGATNLYNDHNTGNVLGELICGKNMYDAEYSTNMDTVEDLHHARAYCGIGQCGSKVFLKYYDENEYTTDLKEGQVLSTSVDTPVQDIGKIEHLPDMNSYQNVEVLESINRFRNSTWHKSNLYSIVINHCGLDDEHFSENLDKIKMDIANSIRVIAESLAPAHTQLFDVTFN